MRPHSHWSYSRPHWSDELPHKRRYLYRRFAFFIGTLAVLFFITLAVILSLTTSSLQETLSRTGMLLLLLCGIPFGFFVLTGILAGWTFRRFASPLAEVMAAADAVAAGDLSARVGEDSPGEMGRLAHSFNRMTAELERAEQQRRNMTADVAHELRTPLQVIQGNLEGILDGLYDPEPALIESILEEVHLLSRLVTDLQTLSLAETGQLPLHKIPISAADLLQDAATSFNTKASEAGVALQVELEGDPQEMKVPVDPQRIGQVLNNLIDNALRHTPPGGKITLRTAAIAGQVSLTVEDTGAGIRSEDLPFVFDRFWKGDQARLRQEGSGSGLGLAIAKQLVEAHGGQISVESGEGQGTRFRIDLQS